jgi:hypothetical protein
LPLLRKQPWSRLASSERAKSRIWYSDQRFWVIFVEFQPSGWSKGGYLNIAVKWLWSPGPGWSFSYRPVDFIPFTSIKQFTLPIEAMAASAAQEVKIVRDRFKRFADGYHYLIAHATRDGWPIYNAAVAAGLAGDEETSRRFFQQMKDWESYGYDWELRLKADSAALAALCYSTQKNFGRKS